MHQTTGVTIQLILLVFAFACFVFAAAWDWANLSPSPYHPRLVALGLAFWVASTFAASF